MTEPLITLQDVTVTAGAATLLSGISATIPRGEMVAVIGPSGAGKTTLLRRMAGLEGVSGGSVAFLGRPMASFSLAELAGKRAYLPQSEQVTASWRCEEVVRLGLIPGRRLGFGASLEPSADERQRVEEILEITGLAPFRNRSFHTLSGGERRRVLFARTLVQNREILFLDEPTAFFDPGRSLRFLDLLRTIHDRYGTSVVMVTHDLQGVLNRFDTALLLREGRLLGAGAPEEILRSLGEEAFGVGMEIGHDPDWGFHLKTREARP